MATKSCPSCSAEVPVEASRCKHCFHDFTEDPPKKSGPMVLLGFLALMMVLGAATLAYLFKFQTADRVVVDEETHSIVITHTSRMATDTERVSFDRVVKVEHVMGGEDAMFEVVAVTDDGKRYIVKSSGEKPLTGDAQHIASVIDKPYVEVKNIKGFGD